MKRAGSASSSGAGWSHVRPGVRAVVASMAAAVWPSAPGALRHRYLYVSFAIFQCFLGAGVIFGWTSLLPMLEAERIYHEFCAPDAPPVCAEQSDRLQYAFTMAGSASMASNLVLGLVFDRFGPRATKALSLVLLATGAVLMGSAHYRPARQGADLLLAGMVLVGFSGPGIQLSGIHISNLFPEAKALVACFIVGGLQLSFLIFALFDLAYTRLGLSMRHIFLGYAAVLLLSLIGTLLIEPDKPFEDVGVASNGSDASATGVEHELLSPMRLPTVFKEEEASLLLSTPELRKFRQRQYQTQQAQAQARRRRLRLPTDGFFFDGADLHNRSFRTQLFSTPFLLITGYFSIQSLWCNFFLGSVTAQLRSKPLSEPQLARLLADLALVLPGSVVFIPVVGYLLETCGFVYSSLLCAALALAFTALAAFAQTPAWLLTGFVTYAFFRTVLFPLLFAYLGHKFGYAHFGALSGMAFCLGGLVGLLQAPIARIGDWQAVSCLQFGSLLLTLAVPLYEYRRGQ